MSSKKGIVIALPKSSGVFEAHFPYSSGGYISVEEKVAMH